MPRHALRLEALEHRAAPAALAPSAAQLEAEARRAALMVAAPVPPLPAVTLLPGGHAAPDFDLPDVALSLAPEDEMPVPDDPDAAAPDPAECVDPTQG